MCVSHCTPAVNSSGRRRRLSSSSHPNGGRPAGPGGGNHYLRLGVSLQSRWPGPAAANFFTLEWPARARAPGAAPGSARHLWRAAGKSTGRRRRRRSNTFRVAGPGSEAAGGGIHTRRRRRSRDEPERAPPAAGHPRPPPPPRPRAAKATAGPAAGIEVVGPAPAHAPRLGRVCERPSLCCL
jgi:hypothetical protein